MQDPGFVKRAFGEIAPRYVLTNHVLSLGIDILWRRRAARLAATLAPRNVLDLATGSGDLALAVQRACPFANVAGADFCPAMLDLARRRGICALVLADGLQLPFDDAAFDLVTIGFGLRNMADYPAACREIARVLRPGGHVIILDFSLPRGPLRPVYRFYLHRILPLAAGILTGKRKAYQYLAGSIESFPSGQAMSELLAAAGFPDPEWIPLNGAIASIYLGERAGG
jgi:demethylmenaquinone methyltransferase/2-methoxy-6-polyprenyl-1,4-benzoquinol methylase